VNVLWERVTAIFDQDEPRDTGSWAVFYLEKPMEDDEEHPASHSWPPPLH
jgi:hypothetical protein